MPPDKIKKLTVKKKSLMYVCYHVIINIGGVVQHP